MEPKAIKYSANDTVNLIVTKADNLCIAYLSDNATQHRQVYGRLTDNAPDLEDSISLAKSLSPSGGTLTVTAVNFSASGRMAFRIEVSGLPADQIDQPIPAYDSKTWAYRFEKK